MRWSWLSVFTPSAAVAALYGDRPASARQAPAAAVLAFASARASVGLYGHVVLAHIERSSVSVFLRGAFVWTPSSLDTSAGPPLATLPFDAVLGVAWDR